MEFVELTGEEYQAFARKHPQASFLQSVELAEMKRSSGIPVYFVGVKQAGTVVAATLLEEHRIIFSQKSFYAPRGFLIDYHNYELLSFFTEKVKQFVKAKGGFRIILDPNYVYALRSSEGKELESHPKDEEAFTHLLDLGYKHFGFNQYLEGMQVRWAYRLLLDEPYEAIKTRFSKSTRKNMESSYKKGLLVRKGTKEDLEVMETLFQNTAERKDFAFRDLNYYKKMYEYMHDFMTIYIAYLEPNHYLPMSKMALEEEQKNYESITAKMSSSMVGAKLTAQKETSLRLIEKYKEEVTKAEQFARDYPNGRDIGCLLSLRSGEEYLTLTSGGFAEYHSFTPKYAMYDQHIQDAYQEGFKACNFYGISGNFEKENNPFYGVYEFKKGFGGNVIEYIGQFTLPVTGFDKIYQILKKLLRK